MKIIQKNKCRVSQDELKIIWDLGEFYLSDFYDTKEEHKEIAPLRLSIGKDSQLIQLKDTVDRDSLYKQYWYVSGTNSTMTLIILNGQINTVPIMVLNHGNQKILLTEFYWQVILGGIGKLEIKKNILGH